MTALPIDVMLTEGEIARDFLQALERREIPEKFFYWFPLSVRAWLALCGEGGAEGGYRNSDRARELVARYARDVAELTLPGAVEVVSLGAGQGDKDRIILDALAAAGRGVSYRPVDASIGLLEIAVREAIAHGYPAIGVKADFTDLAQIERFRHAPSTKSATRLFLMLGNTLGAFDPAALARQLALLMRPNDLTVVDGELFAGAETLAGYDNPVNRRFAFAPLQAAGLTHEDGELVFSTSPEARRAGVFRVEKHFAARRDASLRVAGEAITLRAGERVSMSASLKYDEAAFLEILADAHLSPIAVRRSEDGRFVMAVARYGEVEAREQESD